MLFGTAGVQVDWLTELVVGLRLHTITPFLQDWGGLVGLRVMLPPIPLLPSSACSKH
jgi:hypothetical protein